jgi:hypothetical protein
MNVTHKYTLIEINYINGERAQLDYDNRKKGFDSMNEMDGYREYLCKKLGKEVWFRYGSW